MTVCALDGERMIAVRYSSERESRTLFHNTCVQHLRQLYPDDPQIAALDDDTFLLLSEPLTDMADAWEEVPESTALIARARAAAFSVRADRAGRLMPAT